MKTVCRTMFERRCLSLLEEVRRTGVPIRITMDGVPIAEVVPVRREEKSE